jgi:O-antigen/teichoic acid export membrane protein
MAWVGLLTIPATFGFSILLVRDVAIYRAQHKWALLNGLLRFSYTFVLLLSVLLALAATGIAGVIFSSPTQETLRLTLWFAMPLIPLFALSSLSESSLRGLEFVFRAQLPDRIIRPGFLLVGIVVIQMYWPEHLIATVAMAVNVGAGILALSACIFWLKRLLPSETKEVEKEYEPSPWLKAAFPMLIYDSMQIVLGQTDIVMLGIIRGAEDVGLYAVAYRLAFLLLYVTTASNMIMAPVMSRLYANKEKARLQRILTRAVRISFFSVFPFALILIFCGDIVLTIFGENFVNAHTALAILCIGRLVDVFIGVGTGAMMLNVAGEERTVAHVFVYVACINVLLCLILIPPYGIIGAAMASAISLFASKLVLVVNAAKKIGVYVTVLGAKNSVLQRFNA